MDSPHLPFPATPYRWSELLDLDNTALKKEAVQDLAARAMLALRLELIHPDEAYRWAKSANFTVCIQRIENSGILTDNPKSAAEGNPYEQFRRSSENLEWCLKSAEQHFSFALYKLASCPSLPAEPRLILLFHAAYQGLPTAQLHLSDLYAAADSPEGATFWRNKVEKHRCIQLNLNRLDKNS